MSGKVDFAELTAALALVGASWDKGVWPFVRRFGRLLRREACYIDCSPPDSESAQEVLRAYGIIGVLEQNFVQFLHLDAEAFSEVVDNIPEGQTR